MLSRRKSSGDHPQVVSGSCLDFLAKSLVIPAIYYMKFKLITHKFNIYMTEITSDLVKKGGLRDGLRTISAVTTLLVHTICALYIVTIAPYFTTLTCLINGHGVINRQGCIFHKI
jgi:hypothetical protein